MWKFRGAAFVEKQLITFFKHAYYQTTQILTHDAQSKIISDLCRKQRFKGVTVHIFVPNGLGKDVTVRCVL